MEEVIADVKRVYQEHGKLTRILYDKYGKWSTTGLRSYGTLTGIAQQAGILKKDYRTTKDELVEDVLRVYKMHHPLTKEVYLANGKFSRKPIDRIFGSWNKMLIELGLKVNCLINIPEKDLLQDLQNIQEEYGYVSARLIKEVSKYSLEVYVRRFGSLNNAYQLAGLDTRTPGNPVTAHLVIDLIADILEEKPQKESIFDWLRNDRTNRKLFLDAYFPEHNLAIEYNGLQHYEPCNEWLGYRESDMFEKRQYRDKRKAQLLDEHGIKLLVIKYDEQIDRVSIIKRLAKVL